MFSYAIHAYALYENGNLIKWGPTSMGKKQRLPNGAHLYQLEEGNRHQYREFDWKLRWNFNLYNYLGLVGISMICRGHHVSTLFVFVCWRKMPTLCTIGQNNGF